MSLLEPPFCQAVKKLAADGPLLGVVVGPSVVKAPVVKAPVVAVDFLSCAILLLAIWSVVVPVSTCSVARWFCLMISGIFGLFLRFRPELLDFGVVNCFEVVVASSS